MQRIFFALRSFNKWWLLSWIILIQGGSVFCQSTQPLRIGVYSGTFSPPHVGHEVLIRSSMDLLGLDRLYIIVNVTSDHKADVVAYEHRNEMAKLAFSVIPNVSVADPELQEQFIRGDMAAVIADIRQQNSDAEIYQIMGEDSFERLVHVPSIEDKLRDKNLKIVISPRQENVMVPKSIGQSEVVLLPFAPGVHTSSTKIRDLISHQKRTDELSFSVWKYALHYSLYALRCEQLFGQ